VRLKQGKKFETQIHDLIDECGVSRNQRMSQAAACKQAYLTGRVPGEGEQPAQYNKIYAHVDELESELYSPADVRASIVYDYTQPQDVLDMAQASGSYLSREFRDRKIGLAFQQSLKWGLVKGWCGFKMGWGNKGLEGRPVQSENFGVINESVSGLEEQEAFVHSEYVSPAQIRRLIGEHPEKDELLKKIVASQARKESDPERDTYFHQIVIGGTNPVATAGPTSPQGGLVSVIGGPVPVIHPSVAQDLIRLDELWVLDDERQDWTTVRSVYPDIIIEGKLQRRNLFLQGSLKGIHPFTEVVPLPIDGYFWGQSELAQILGLQDMINKRLNDFNQIWRKQADPPMSAIGTTGMTDEKMARLRRARGWISDENPNAKITPMPPTLPEGAFQEFKDILTFFQDIAGSSPIMSGKGEPGVRAGTHARTLLRSASGRVRDRALLTESDLEDVLDLSLSILQAKVAHQFKLENGQEFLLSQLPDDYTVRVDSHSASPAFSEDAQEQAYSLHNAGAIDEEDLIMLTNPPHQDILLARAKARAAAKAKFLQEHPEAAAGGKKK
jgi:hypothetical protein